MRQELTLKKSKNAKVAYSIKCRNETNNETVYFNRTSVVSKRIVYSNNNTAGHIIQMFLFEGSEPYYYSGVTLKVAIVSL